MKSFKQFILEARKPLPRRLPTFGKRLRDPKETLGSAIKKSLKDRLHPAQIAKNLLGKTAGSIVGKLTGASQERMNTLQHGYEK